MKQPWAAEPCLGKAGKYGEWTPVQEEMGKTRVRWSDGGSRLEFCHLPPVGSVPGFHVGLPWPNDREGNPAPSRLTVQEKETLWCFCTTMFICHGSLLVWKWRLLYFLNFLNNYSLCPYSRHAGVSFISDDDLVPSPVLWDGEASSLGFIRLFMNAYQEPHRSGIVQEAGASCCSH